MPSLIGRRDDLAPKVPMTKGRTDQRYRKRYAERPNIPLRVLRQYRRQAAGAERAAPLVPQFEIIAIAIIEAPPEAACRFWRGSTFGAA